MFRTKEFRILKSEPILIFSIPICLIIFLLLIIIRPIILIRFGLLHSDRIGHFIINTEIFFCEKRLNEDKRNVLDLFYFPTKPCNYQFAKMLKRKIIILPKIIIRPFCLISRKFKFLSIHVTGKSIGGDYDVKNTLDKFKPQVSFTNNEIEYGMIQLNKMGVKKNQKIICLAVRDDSYLKKKFPNANFNYHNHRNDQINKYLPTIKYLTNKNYFVIRMGSVTKEKIKFNHKNFIDYSRSKFKSDFMDIFIPSRCMLFISNNTGVDAIGLLFRKPLLHLGSIPLGAISTFSYKIFNTMQNHFSLKLKRNLTVSEIFKYKLSLGWTSDFFLKNRIKLIKFSSNEILIYIKEVINILSHKKLRGKTKIEKKFTVNFVKNLKKFPEVQIFHGKIKSHFLNTFLKRNKNFLY